MQTEDARELSIQQAFERSRIPQAIVNAEGHIVTSNRAFNKFVNRDDKGAEGVALGDTSLTTHVPGLVRALRIVHTSGKPAERKSQVQRSKGRAPLEVTVWLTPLPIPGQEIHLLIRVEELEFSTSAGD
jgi:hypothetical protein